MITAALYWKEYFNSLFRKLQVFSFEIIPKLDKGWFPKGQLHCRIWNSINFLYSARSFTHAPFCNLCIQHLENIGCSANHPNADTFHYTLSKVSVVKSILILLENIGQLSCYCVKRQVFQNSNILLKAQILAVTSTVSLLPNIQVWITLVCLPVILSRRHFLWRKWLVQFATHTTA